MANVEVKCPTCGDRKVYKYGKSKTGEQVLLRHKYRCSPVFEFITTLSTRLAHNLLIFQVNYFEA